jgi:hypothetical protein
MRREVLATIFLTACSFDHGSAADIPDGGPPPYTGSGAPNDGGVDGVQPTGPAASCHSSLPGVRLCLDFEPPALSKDQSGHVVDVSNVTQISRAMQGAAQLSSTSRIYVEDRSDLEITPQLSMEMWIAPHRLPSSQDKTWLVSNTNEYGIGLMPSGLFCGVASATSEVSASAGVSLPLDKWMHVACVYDGDIVKLYLGGNVIACSQGSITIDTTVRAGIDIGSAYEGGLDDVHIYAGALADQDICQLATGGTQCKSACAP